ncbi:probable low-specificity L-threonine aldolase 2 isoform X1 [Myzus persicae]|uniref:probable low-specificity L-threonine aldolase 2 isoform X1 n=1 Tax=Myzus persicae TaxID=13164 RepID=UPI000B9377BF|nr:probable low-specificity L-threonine aldolase 2 isoform X1 [Myzus persicae]XP_022162898.1 probable low-specificity L-threonine aldolase 2 isoform X1 [Myzus persicae]XP_022162899.1 probable low-specificity L-threonine aldolase 2 isoform X1 [Myzus persicae]XP_022162900.1 probable low-specificity L-threonine aldolase 2 isoform X1 [Myzus persicae]
MSSQLKAYEKLVPSENDLQLGEVIDLRSDTVTKPDVPMRQAMFDAEVGDDGYGEDPTINLLEEKTSKLFEKEAAIFLPSGLMGNLIAMMVHSKQRGGEVIVGHKSHILLWEQGGASQIAGLQMREVRNLDDGTLDMTELLGKIRPEFPDPHEPYTTLVCIENTHNYCGGTVLPVEWIDQLGKLTKERNIPLHMDGARVFNAAVSLGVPVSRIVKHCDSVTFCLSKGLGAPIGSILVGEKLFIERARRIRKVLGGAMRQAGIVAAAGLYALDNCVERLADDHRNAKKIAYAIQRMASPHVTVNPDALDTNILLVNINPPRVDAKYFVSELIKVDADGLDSKTNNKIRSTAVRIAQINDARVRIVTHKKITDTDVDMAIEKIKYVIGKIDTTCNR